MHVPNDLNFEGNSYISDVGGNGCPFLFFFLFFFSVLSMEKSLQFCYVSWTSASSSAYIEFCFTCRMIITYFFIVEAKLVFKLNLKIYHNLFRLFLVTISRKFSVFEN